MPELVAQVESRVLRGLALWRTHRQEMDCDGSGDWYVPSEAAPGGTHRVSLVNDSCTCASHRYSKHKCKHMWAVEFELALVDFLTGALGADDPCAPEDLGGKRTW